MNTKFFKAGLIPAFLILISFTQSLIAQDVQGIWVVRHSITSPEKVRRLITFASVNGYTDLFVQVRGRGDAYYNSSIVPRAHLLPKNAYDPLKDIIPLAHAKGIRIHAWVNMYLSWSARKLPRNPEHIVNKYPHWVEVNSSGKSDLEFVSQNGRNGREGVYLSPMNDQVNNHLLQVINEIVASYQVDGVHLDYVRFQDRNYGYNRDGRKKFLMTYNVDPITLGNGNGSYWYRLNPEEKEKYWIYWNEFRRAELSRYIQRISNSIHQINPAVKLSAAVKPNPEVARKRFFQDWPAWLSSGSMDFVVPMNYAVPANNFTHSMSMMKNERLPLDRIYMGIATYNQDSSTSGSKIHYARNAGFNNLVIFSYDTYEKNPRYFDQIHRNLRK
ncbi:MAG: family 10 glycosylhydrolase [Candidatus Marinimicrobia bacterium]|nr:family 10 glycosylhydrolase [Candidatus Neomarinimicrobiota bacterium]MCF7851477.1 family 10 glycosylhydrolase [Candidatus Neomarinimicrobiota bacterium]MCF7904736.1 family 10 glycosylhydrolase [Candidatus Neomarinimicrobiota bacterium]